MNYTIFFRPDMRVNSSYNPLSMLVRSIMPNFNLEVIKKETLFNDIPNYSLEFSCSC